MGCLYQTNFNSFRAQTSKHLLFSQRSKNRHTHYQSDFIPKLDIESLKVQSRKLDGIKFKNKIIDQKTDKKQNKDKLKE